MCPAEATEKNRHWKVLLTPRKVDALDDVLFLTDYRCLHWVRENPPQQRLHLEIACPGRFKSALRLKTPVHS